MSIFTKLFGDPNDRVIKSLEPIIDQINSYEEGFKNLSDQELKDKTSAFKEILGTTDVERNFSWSKSSEQEESLQALEAKLEDILPEAFAVLREASRRVIGQRHYDVQLMGGIVLHRGQIAEMKTGEGKTLVATLPLYLNALSGRGVQLVTVNDYLARVGAGWMAPVFHALGLRTAVIIHDQALEYDPGYTDESQYDDRLKHFRLVDRRQAYDCDVLYGTNNEFGFDFLRDNMAPSLDRMVQRELHYAIVDEVDSILIDEARTPLIISAPAEESTDKYYKYAQLIGQLKEVEDYNIDEKMRASTLTESGIAKMEKWLGVENIYVAGGIREVNHIEQALKAQALFKRDRDYVVKDGEVIIVDEFTGRLMFGRRYSEGLHQAIEAKEGVKIQRESMTLATVTFQNYFRLYHKLGGMTGTALTEAEEFHKIYDLDTTAIPTHRAMVRKDFNDLIYKSEEGKYQAVIQEIKRRNEKGQPILIGTISIEKNEYLSLLMEREGLRPQILNAKNHEKEAKIISDAGRSGAITIATNMAGRGVDIMLGGNQPDKNSPEYAEWKKEHDKVVALGGLHVIGTERHESRRIDNQLRGRAGRQGDPGSSQFYLSMEDDLMRIFGGDRMKSIMTTLNVPDDMPIENKLISRSIESAQKKVESNNFDIRKHLVEYDDVLNKHRDAIYRRRREILLKHEEAKKAGVVQGEMTALSPLILKMIDSEIERVVGFHTSAPDMSDWNVTEIFKVVSTIFPVNEKLKEELLGYSTENHKLDRLKAQTELIEHLNAAAQDRYAELIKLAQAAGLEWIEVEKSILIHSIDELWVEHLEAISSVRQGIGLRGYGQRDPLVEYKKESYALFNELISLIEQTVVYGIFKVGHAAEIDNSSLIDMATTFSAPAKEMAKGANAFIQGANKDKEGRELHDLVHEKAKNSEGDKIGRNDPCPCGSGQKFKKCCGK